MSIKIYSLSKDGNKKISDHFKVCEFACKDGSDEIKISDELVAILQKIRNHFNCPVVINSAYRNENYNKKIGGASKSQHILGTASDIEVKGVLPIEVAKYVEYLMPKSGGIGVYDNASGNFTHIDVRTNRVRWKQINHKEIVTNGFEGYKQILETGNDIVWELKNKHKIDINDIENAIVAIDKARKENSSIYWILYKVVNGNG